MRDVTAKDYPAEDLTDVALDEFVNRVFSAGDDIDDPLPPTLAYLSEEAEDGDVDAVREVVVHLPCERGWRSYLPRRYGGSKRRRVLYNSGSSKVPATLRLRGVDVPCSHARVMACCCCTGGC